MSSPKYGFQMMCHNSMQSIILENLSPSLRIVTHHLETIVGRRNMGCVAFDSYFLGENLMNVAIW
jgi:hypothetical protein